MSGQELLGRGRAARSSGFFYKCVVRIKVDYPRRVLNDGYGFFFRSRIVAFSVRLLLIKTS